MLSIVVDNRLFYILSFALILDTRDNESDTRAQIQKGPGLIFKHMCKFEVNIFKCTHSSNPISNDWHSGRLTQVDLGYASRHTSYIYLLKKINDDLNTFLKWYCVSQTTSKSSGTQHDTTTMVDTVSVHLINRYLT